MDLEDAQKLMLKMYGDYCYFENTAILMKSIEERDRLLADSKFNDPTRLEKYGYKVYSQNDEDGIITEIFKRIGTTSKFFVEFGVESGIENNTLYLLLQNWSGVWLEGSPEHVSAINKNFVHYLNNKKLTVANAMINCGNINMLLMQTGCAAQDVDLLSIDIDGNDYHVLEKINVINPRVIVIEYNAKFPPPARWIMKYNPEHMWDGSDMMGMSLQVLEDLALKKGYQLVGTNLTGSNAFLVRNDIAGNLFTSPATAENLYNPPRYHLMFTTGHRLIKTPVNGLEL